MSITARRIIYLIFLLVFFISAPLLLFYTSGYRFNAKERTIEATGILILAFTPKDATILLNGAPPTVTRQINETTHISDLRPGSYRIDVAKDGYTSWTKQLDILPGQTTFARHIILWKKSTPEEQDLKKQLAKKTEKEEKSDWAILTDRSVGRMRLEYKPQKTSIFPRTSYAPILLPSSSGYLLLPSVAPLVTLLDTSYHLLYLLDPGKKDGAEYLDVITNVQSAAWSPDEQTLAWVNDHELWSYDREKRTRIRITTERQPIQSFAWHPTGGDLFYLTKKKIKVIEFDDRDMRNQHDLVSNDNLHAFTFNPDGTVLTFTTKEGEEEKVLNVLLR